MPAASTTPARESSGPAPCNAGRRALLAGLAGLAGCSRVDAPVPFTQSGGLPPEEIVVTRRSWHTDICFPATDLPAPIDSIAERFPGVAWFAVGFGDRSWFMEGARGPLATLNALSGGPAALLFTGLAAAPEVAFERYESVRLRIAPAGLAAIKRFIADQLESAEPLARGPYRGSLFYATRLPYALSYTCNTWTLDGLRAGGLGADPTGVVFADQVMAAVRALPTRV
jgi:hypothetical protein